jgi:hypothetical protein
MDDKSGKNSISYTQHLDNSFSHTAANSVDGQNFLEMASNTDLLKRRDAEITNLVSSINELSHIFKDLSFLVFEQGMY